MVMRIQTLREEAGLTQSQLAVRMGTNQNTVSNWENEVSLPKTRDLPLLAVVLGRTINDLFVEASMPEAI